MNFIHRATKLQGINPEKDRCIYADGERIARVYEFEAGPQQGQWGWFGQWDSGGNVGTVDTLEEALYTVKTAYKNQFH